MNCHSFRCLTCCFRTNILTFVDLILVFLSFGSFFIDIATDIAVISQYYRKGHFMWMILTSSLVCVSSIMVQIFSFRWFLDDGKVTKFLLFIHMLQLGLFYRFIELFRNGLQVSKTKCNEDLERFNQQQSDMCMLRLFESFSESAPQLVLQLYIMVTTDVWNLWTGISAIASIVSLSWGISAYSKAMRNIRPEKQKLSWWGLLFQALWRIGMVSSRIISLVLFAVSFGYWLIIALCVHWLCMILWIFFQNTDFCSTWWEERLYNCVVGIIYCFCFFNLKEGKSRYRMGFFYSLTILQNIICVSAFYIMTENSYLKNFVVISVSVGMVIGLICMLLYYRFFHPSGPIVLFSQPISLNKMENGARRYSSSTLKTCRKLTHEVQLAIPTTSVDHISPTSDSNTNDLNLSDNYFIKEETEMLFTCSLMNNLIKCNMKCFYCAPEIFNIEKHHEENNLCINSVIDLDTKLTKKYFSCLVLSKNSENLKVILKIDSGKRSYSHPNLEFK